MTLRPDVHADADSAPSRMPPGLGGGSAGPAAAGRPQGPLPWSRRWAAVAAGVRPLAVARCPSRNVRLAASRSSAESVGASGSRKRSKSSPGVRSGEPRVQSDPTLSRLLMAVPRGNGAAAKSVPDVSSTKACPGSAIRNDESYASWCAASAIPPWPCVVRRSTRMSSASLGAAGPLQPEPDQVHADEAGAAPAPRRAPWPPVRCRWPPRTR